MKNNLLNRTSIQVGIILICLLIGFGQTIHADSWEQVQPPGPAPDACSGHSLTAGDRVGPYLFGGLDGAGEVLNELWGFNKDNGAWEKEEPDNDSPSGRYYHAAVVYNGKLYIYGGQGADGLLGDLWVYDFATRTWTQLPPGDEPPEARQYASIFGYSGKIYLFGGQDASGENRMDGWTYDLTNNTWTSWLTDAPCAGQSLALWQNKVYVWGGTRWSATDFHEGLRVCDLNLPDGFYFVYTYGEVPGERAFHVGVFQPPSDAVGPRILTAGGTGPAPSSGKRNVGVCISDSDTVLNDTRMLDLETNTWTRLADLPVGLTHAAAAVVDTSNNHVLLFGGKKNDGTLSGETYMYLPEDTDVEEAETMPLEFSLFQNYPNPFNPETEIEFSISRDEKVQINVFNNQGHLLETLVDSYIQAGRHSVVFDGKDCASGVYFYQIRTTDHVKMKKMVLLK